MLTESVPTAERSKYQGRQIQFCPFKNQQAIGVLFAKYKRSIGRFLVGKEYESVMWAVIQHSDLAMMQKFLPTLQVAVTEKEIDVVPFEMLIDRIYTIKTKQQIFGSQGGYPLADEKARAAVKLEFGLE